MADTNLYSAIFASCRKRGLGISLEDVGEETDIEVGGLQNAPLFAIYWKKGKGEIHFSSLYEFAGEAPDYRLVNGRIKETPFVEVRSNDGEFLLDFIGHLKREEVTEEAMDSLFEKLSQGSGFLKELQSLSLKKGEPLPLDGSSYEKVRGYFETYGDGRARIIRRVFGLRMSEVQHCIDRLLKEGLIVPDEDYEYVLIHSR